MSTHSRSRGGYVDGRGSGRGRGRGRGRGDSRGRGRGTSAWLPPPPPQAFSHAQLGNEWQDPPVNEDSNQAEDGFVQALTLSQTSLKEDFPSRPSYGTAGDSIELWSNFFLLSFAAGKEFFFYEIEISPNIPNTRLTNKAIRRIVRLYLSQEPFRSRVATDYSKFLVSPFDLRQEYDVEEKPRRLVLFWDTQDPPTNVNEEQRNTFYVQLNFKAEQSAKIVQFLRSLRDPTIPRVEQEEIMQSLNMIMSQDAKNRTFGMDPKVMAVGRNRFYRLRDEHPEQPFDLTGGLQAYRGYLLSVRPTAAFARLLVQVKHAASYKQGALKTIIDEFRRDIDSNLKKLDSFLALVKVSTHHLPKKKNREGEDVVRVKTICSLSRKANNSRTKSPFLGANPWQVQFHFDNNPPVQGLRAGWVSVGEYFRHKYSTAVSKNYPVINVGSNGHPSWLPAEVLHVLPGQPVLRELHPWHTAEMIKVAARKAKLNATAVAQDSLKMLGIKPANSSILDEFGINVDPHLTKIQARVLPAPDIEYQKSRFITPQNASWNLKEFELVRPVKIKSWVVLCLKSGDIKDDRWAEHDHLEACIKTFYQTLKKLKITIGEPIKDFGQKKSYRELKVDFRSSKSFVAIEQTLKALPRVDFVLVLVSKEEKPIFNWVKRFGDCQHGLLTRYAVGSKFARNSSQYFANLGLKVNVGLSGVNHLLSQSQNKLSFISQGQTMLVGYDVGHPSDRQRKEAQSVVGIVASIDRYAAQYYGDVAVQSAGKEFVESLKELVKGRLSLWKENNKNELPGNVIFYRDGVGESMYGQVKERELGEITKACGEVYLNRPFPRISFIVVGKRHHVRFYPTVTVSGAIDERSWSAPPGTCIDRTITDPHLFDWYLQPHKPLQGTAKSCHYVVLHDEVFRAEVKRLPNPPNLADFIQIITHNLCYTWQVSTGAVSIAPPAYYADRLCDRVQRWYAQFFDTTASDNSSDGGSDLHEHAIRIHPRLYRSMFYV